MPTLLLTMLVTLAGLPQHPQHAMAAKVMGFDQTKTSHHFRLYADGGAIEVTVKDRADATNLTAIRAHLPHVAQLFGWKRRGADIADALNNALEDLRRGGMVS